MLDMLECVGEERREEAHPYVCGRFLFVYVCGRLSV